MNAVQLDDRGLLVSCPQCSQRNRIAYERLGHTLRCGHCHTYLNSPSGPITVQTRTSFDSLVQRSALPVLVDFWAAWCGPCRMLAPELVKVAEEGVNRWLVAKVNTEELPELAERFAVSSIPTLAVFQEGQEIGRQSGAAPADRIVQFLEQGLLASR